MMSAFALWYISFGVRWLSGFAWPDGRFVMITEDTHEFAVAMARILFGLAFAGVTYACLTSEKLTARSRFIFLGLLLIPPLLMSILLGLTCAQNTATAFGVQCTGNAALYKLTLMTGASGLLAAAIPVILFASRTRR